MLRSRIVDPETNKDCGPNQAGELLLSGPNIMLGYHNRPEATAETLVKDEKGDIWLKTGDIGHVDEQGAHFITDRYADSLSFVAQLAAHFTYTEMKAEGTD